MGNDDKARGARFRKREQWAGGMTCSECGKLCWPTRKLAKRKARNVHAGEPGRVYKCGNYWHTTTTGSARTTSYREYYYHDM